MHVIFTEFFVFQINVAHSLGNRFCWAWVQTKAGYLNFSVFENLFYKFQIWSFFCINLASKLMDQFWISFDTKIEPPISQIDLRSRYRFQILILHKNLRKSSHFGMNRRCNHQFGLNRCKTKLFLSVRSRLTWKWLDLEVIGQQSYRSIFHPFHSTGTIQMLCRKYSVKLYPVYRAGQSVDLSFHLISHDIVHNPIWIQILRYFQVIIL